MATTEPVGGDGAGARSAASRAVMRPSAGPDQGMGVPWTYVTTHVTFSAMAISHPPKNTRLPVLDRAALAAALAVLERHHGTQVAAARALGIQQGHFSKLRRGQGGNAITVRLYTRIREELARASSQRRRARKRSSRGFASTPLAWKLARAVAAPEVQERLDAWGRWLVRTYGHFLPAHETTELAKAPWRQLAESFPEWARGYLRDSRQAWEEAGHPPRRIELAVARAMAPLLAHAESGGIERSWQELERSKRGRKNDLTAYLKAALTAEDILLRREPHPLRRAAQVAQGPAPGRPRPRRRAHGARAGGR